MTVYGFQPAEMRDEAFRAVQALDERCHTKAALHGCIIDLARYIIDLTDRLAVMEKVAHAAWHTCDDSMESDDTDDDGVPERIVSGLDWQSLSDALDALEATGWDAHPQADGGEA